MSETSPSPSRPWRLRLARAGIALAGLQRALRLDTLKTQVSLAAVLALLLGMAATAGYMDLTARAELLADTQRRSQADAERGVAVVGRRVGEIQRALRESAPHISAEMLAQPALMRDFLARQPVLRLPFAYLGVAGLDGRLAMLAGASGVRRMDVDISDRAYFRQTLALRQPMVSNPMAGRIASEPVVVFTQPLDDLQGQPIGMLVGGMRLAHQNLLDDLTSLRGLDRDTLIVVTNRDGHILAHPNPARLARELSDEPRLAAAFAAWRAAGRPAALPPVAAASLGDEVVAVAQDAASGWTLWRASSKSVLLEPLQTARVKVLVLTLGLAALLSTLLWAFIARQLRPLHELQRRAADLMSGDESARWPRAQGEVGDLSQTLRRLWRDRARAQVGHAELLGKLGSVMEASPVGLALTRDQRYELVNAETCRILGYSEAGLIGQPTAVIFTSQEEYLRLGRDVGAAFGAGRPYVGEWRLRRAQGDTFWGRLMGRPVTPGDPAAGTIWSLHDISDQVSDRLRLHHAATHDALTGVLNRKGFMQRVDEALHDAAMDSALVVVDLDHFKPVNDTAGHAAGDAVLQAVAAALGQSLRASDHVGRLGGDEFGLLLRGCDVDAARALAERARLAVEDVRVPWSGRELRVGASLGVAAMAPHCADAEAWLQDADSACYGVKRAGRGAVRVHTTVPNPRAGVSAPHQGHPADAEGSTTSV